MGDVSNAEGGQPQGNQQQENQLRNQVQPRNLYEVLGVPNSATKEEINKAFKDRAKELHPDSNGGSKAEEEFKRVNEAFQVLKDPDKSSQYKRLGHDGYYGQTGGWNPLPKPEKSTSHQSGETVRRPSTTGRGSAGSPPMPDYDVGNLYDDIGNMVGDFIRGDTSNPSRKRPAEQWRSAQEHQERKPRTNEYAEAKAAETRKEEARKEERKVKFKESGAREAMEYANVLFMPTIRAEMGQILGVIIEEKRNFSPQSLRVIREQVLYHIDQGEGLLSDNVIDKLVKKYSADNELNPLNINNRNIREVVSGLIMRLRVARSLVQGNTKPADLPGSGDDKSTREAFSSEFNRVWNNISTYGEPVDKKKNWFVPLTPEEVVIERRRARDWINAQGFLRGKYLKQLSGSPDAVEDEKFVKEAIKKSRGLLGSLLTDKKGVDDQYKYFMNNVGRVGGNQYIKDVLVIAEKTFKKRFSQEEDNRGKDITVEWEKTLARLKDESEALELQERLQKNITLPRPDSQKLKEEYYKTDPLGGFPGADIDLYNAGLKEGFAE